MFSISSEHITRSNYLLHDISTSADNSRLTNIKSRETSSITANDFNILYFSNIEYSFNAEREVLLIKLIDFRYKLRKPLKVKIRRQNWKVIGTIPELNIYEIGSTDFDVLRKINKEVTKLFNESSNLNENQFRFKPAGMKEFLTEYIEREFREKELS